MSDPICMWCGKTLAGHEEDYESRAVWKCPCLGLKVHFSPRPEPQSEQRPSAWPDGVAAAQHTPGPLRVICSARPSDGAYDFAIVDSAGKVIAETFGRVGISDLRPAEANARLFAAAADLAHALLMYRKTVRFLPSGTIPQELVCHFIRAEAQAEEALKEAGKFRDDGPVMRLAEEEAARDSSREETTRMTKEELAARLNGREYSKVGGTA